MLKDDNNNKQPTKAEHRQSREEDNVYICM